MKILYGGWYQRTTLHLSEVYDLFALGHSKLPLSHEKLQKLKDSLEFKTVTREVGYLEYVKGVTKGGITVKYYEDGLYTLDKDSVDIKSVREELVDYFDNKLIPALNYIFSLGAPTPKILANISTEHPVVVTTRIKNISDYKVDEEKFGEVYSQVPSGDFYVYKTPHYIFVLYKHKDEKIALDLVDMQIFFREFKDQMEKYLNIHRTIWEEISQIKEKRQIAGRDIKKARAKLDQYQKTVSLISNRINQMSSYVETRKSISKELKIEDNLQKLYQYKFDSLSDTLNYIKEIWKMTSDYIANAIQVMVEVENNSLNNSVKSLQIITSVGVISGLIGYLSRESLPKLTPTGIKFFVVLVVAALIINYLISIIYSSIRYKLKFTDRKEDI
jgi:Mg2+ and Co2+ transporter CorA